MNKSKYLPSVSEWALILILVIGIFLRIWRLESTMIFFADAGRDMLAAVEMNKTGQIPLLGIPSSVPRFKQGPVFIWTIALIFKVAGTNPLLVGYVMAIINCIALLFCYTLVKKNANTIAALFTTFLLAVSPLAVAHSRMPYHVTPIISFLLLYLWSIQRLIEKKPRAVFITALCWALLFQFELALFPLIILIPFTLWRTKSWKKIFIVEVILGLEVGLFPQLFYDVTHKFAQLGGFLLWLVYRFASFFAIGRSHAISPGKLEGAWNIFIQYFSRIFSLDHKVIGVIMFFILIISVIFVWKKSKQNLFVQEVLISLVLLLAALFVHGTPSEAYFPPIILLSCIVIGMAVSFLPRKTQLFSIVALLILAAVNTIQITKNNFFTQPSQSTFNYGPSYLEQIHVTKFIIGQSAGEPYQLRSTDSESKFETYLDNYRVIGLLFNPVSEHVHGSSSVRLFFINKKDSDLSNYPQAKITFFPSTDVIEVPNIQSNEQSY